MRIYETTFILSPQADDAAFDRQIKSVAELITRHDGRILSEERMGIRRLAYPIKKFTQGYYARIIFEGNNNVLREVDRLYRLEEPYIRNLTVQFEGAPEDISDEFARKAESKRSEIERDTQKIKDIDMSESGEDEKVADVPVSEEKEIVDEGSSDSELSAEDTELDEI